MKDITLMAKITEGHFIFKLFFFQFCPEFFCFSCVRNVEMAFMYALFKSTH